MYGIVFGYGLQNACSLGAGKGYARCGGEFQTHYEGQMPCFVRFYCVGSGGAEGCEASVFHVKVTCFAAVLDVWLESEVC